MSLEREDGEEAGEQKAERRRPSRAAAAEPAAGEWASDEGEAPEEERRGPWLSTQRIVWIALVLATIVALSLLWSACEQRYQSCLAKVEAKYAGANDNLSNFVRRQEAEDCSRSPF